MEIKKILPALLLSILLTAFIPAIASQPESEAHHEGTKEKFDPGSFIFDHIFDAYEWHIFTYKDFHCTIPLLAILYSESSGFHAFPTSQFHHGHEAHEGFRIAAKGEAFEGKIVEHQKDGTWQRPLLDLSITKNIAALFVSAILLVWIFTSVGSTYKKNKGKAPHGLQNAVEPLIIFIRDDVAIPAIGKKKYERFLPYLLSVFFFIFLNNLFGLIPIPPFGANLTGNIGITLTLALFTFIITHVHSNKNYWKHIVNTPGVPWWLKFPIPLMPVVEIMGMFTKPFVLMVRLFANISAGHIIGLGFYSLIFVFGEMSAYAGYGISIISVAFTIFMSMLELLVAFIQAYVFTLLSALYFGMATEEHH